MVPTSSMRWESRENSQKMFDRGLDLNLNSIISCYYCSCAKQDFTLPIFIVRNTSLKDQQENHIFPNSTPPK